MKIKQFNLKLTDDELLALRDHWRPTEEFDRNLNATDKSIIKKIVDLCGVSAMLDDDFAKKARR